MATPRPTAPLVVDLHAHYPMHLHRFDRARFARVFRSPLALLLARRVVTQSVFRLVSRAWNHDGVAGRPRVTVEAMREGGVQAALSVLYSPLDELAHTHGGRAPESGALQAVIHQLEHVEATVADSPDAAFAHDRAELTRLAAEGRLALVHCVEGGFHLSPETPVEAAVAQLAERGVAYITLAHLFYRQVATNANAIPFIPDRVYHLVFRQRADLGLATAGVAAVKAMVRHGVLIDLAHMSDRARDETLDLLDVLDPGRTVPVVVTHAGYRFGRQEYMIPADGVTRIAARGGVIGLILATHQLYDGLPERPRHGRPLSAARRRRAAFAVLVRHIDAIAAAAGGSYDHVAIGSDLDGFIKPTLPGVKTMEDMRHLSSMLAEHYGDEIAAKLCHGNALRLLGAWGAAPPGAPV